MWKSYDRFYSQILKLESGLLFKSTNSHISPALNNVSVVYVTRLENSRTKDLLVNLALFKLIWNKQPQFINSKTTYTNSVTRKGQPLGCKLVFRKRFAREFAHFFLFLSLPRIGTGTRHVGEKRFQFVFSIKPRLVYNKITQFTNSFLASENATISLSLTQDIPTNRLFFWRLFKFPSA